MAYQLHETAVRLSRRGELLAGALDATTNSSTDIVGDALRKSLSATGPYENRNATKSPQCSQPAEFVRSLTGRYFLIIQIE
jgi:hypothetical protein